MKVLGKVPRDVDRTVPAAGAAETDRRAILPLALVLRQQKVDEREETGEEWRESGIALDEGSDVGIVAGSRLEERIVVGILEKTHVEEQVELHRYPVFEAESDDGDVHVKWFSPERANALIPRLAPLVDELLAHRRELAIKLLENDPALHGMSAPGAHLARPRSPFGMPRFGDLKGEIVRLIHRIESFGCIVKDIDLGLIDFPSLRENVPVYLCWKAGEPEVMFWHATDTGFQEREPIDFV